MYKYDVRAMYTQGSLRDNYSRDNNTNQFLLFLYVKLG